MSVSYGGQAVLEGVMMRGPAVWSVAVRTPNGDVVEVTKSVVSPMQRHRIWRLPVIRGVVALGESLAIGFRALAISANYALQEEPEEGAEGEPVEVSTEISRWQIIVSFVIAIGFALALFKVGPALLTSWLPIDGTYSFVVVEGLIRVAVLIGYIVLIGLAAGPEAGLRVSRRRAQGDQRARGRLRADAGEGAEVQFDPPALRNCFFAMGHGDRRVRLRARRSARLVLAHHQPDPPPAGDRRARVRADPLRRQAPGQPRPDDAARAGPVAAAADDEGAVARPDRGVDSRLAGSDARRAGRERERAASRSPASRSWPKRSWPRSSGSVGRTAEPEEDHAKNRS